MNICLHQFLVELFICILNICLVCINLIYNQKSLKYGDYVYKLGLSFVPVLVSELYIIIYFNNMIILPFGCFVYMVNIITTGFVEISKGLMSMMIVLLVLVNPVLIITAIIELTVQCQDNYSTYIYIITASTISVSVMVSLLTLILVTSIEVITNKYSTIINKMYLQTFNPEYENIQSESGEVVL